MLFRKLYLSSGSRTDMWCWRPLQRTWSPSGRWPSIALPPERTSKNPTHLFSTNWEKGSTSPPKGETYKDLNSIITIIWVWRSTLWGLNHSSYLSFAVICCLLLLFRISVWEGSICLSPVLQKSQALSTKQSINGSKLLSFPLDQIQSSNIHGWPAILCIRIRYSRHEGSLGNLSLSDADVAFTWDGEYFRPVEGFDPHYGYAVWDSIWLTWYLPPSTFIHQSPVVDYSSNSCVCRYLPDKKFLMRYQWHSALEEFHFVSAVSPIKESRVRFPAFR